MSHLTSPWEYMMNESTDSVAKRIFLQLVNSSMEMQKQLQRRGADWRLHSVLMFIAFVSACGLMGWLLLLTI